MINNFFDVVTIDDANKPFTSGSNDYSCFKELVGKYGVYVFQERHTGQVQYVGMASKQDLKDRIVQNYTKKDTGGTFRINFCEVENKPFDDFKKFLSTCNIKIMSIDTDQKSLIAAIEAILISALKPKYNKT